MLTKDEYYVGIARMVAQRSTCLRRHYGAVIVTDDEIISTGYNGAPRGRINCCDIKHCVRDSWNIPHGERYELCRSVHAEMNAIISASRSDIMTGTLYLAGEDAKTGELVDSECCSMCKRCVINADLYRVVTLMRDGSLKSILVRDWIFNDESIDKNWFSKGEKQA